MKIKRYIMIMLFVICAAVGVLFRTDGRVLGAEISDEYLFNLPDVETDLSDSRYKDAKEWKVTSAEGFSKLGAGQLSGCTVYLTADFSVVAGKVTMSDVTFDGLGHTLTVTSGSALNNYSGLFQSLQSCKIRNLNVKGNITYSGYLQIGVGMLAGYANKTTFEYCHSSGSLQNNASSYKQENYSAIGGLVGCASYCTFTACSNSAGITYPMTRGSMDDTVYIGGIVGQVVDCKIYGCYQKSATLGSTFYWSAYGITTHANGYGIAGYVEYGADYTPVIDGCYSEANLVSENAEYSPLANSTYSSTTSFERNYVYNKSINSLTSFQATYVGSDMKAAEVAWKMNYKDGVNRGWWTVSSSTGRPILADSPQNAIYRYKWSSSDAGIYSTYGVAYYNAGKEITITIDDVPAGYQFNGVRIGDTMYEAAGNTCTFVMPEKDVTAVYDFSLIKYKVTYHLDGGLNAPSNPATIDTATSSTLKDAGKTGYRFMGWYDNKDYVGTPVTEISQGTNTDLELWALFEKTYNITYVMNGGRNHLENPTDFIASETIVLQTPTKEGYRFTGWFTDQALTNQIEQISGSLTKDQTVYAGWEIRSYTIYFNQKDYPGQPDITVTYGTDLQSYEPAVPTKEGYLFGGWYISQRFEEKFEFTTMPAKNVTLYARWYKISLDELSYSSVNDFVYSGEKYEPTVVVKNGNYTLGKGIDYDILYRNNQNPGKAEIVITGKGIYEGEHIISFMIDKCEQQISVPSSSITKKVGDASFNLGVTTTGDGKVVYKSSNPAVVAVDQTGKVTVIDAGVTFITVMVEETAYGKDNTCKIRIAVSENPSASVPKVGDMVKVKGVSYKVTSQGKNKCVSYVKANIKSKKVTILSTIKIGKTTYRVTSVADNAFAGNKKLTSVTIPTSVTKIGKGAFRKCSALKTVTISKSIKEIGKDAFRDCKSLKKITFKGTKVQKIGKNAFKNINKKAVIKVPASKKKKYQTLIKKSGCKIKVKK